VEETQKAAKQVFQKKAVRRHVWSFHSGHVFMATSGRLEGTLGGGFVDNAELKSHRLDAQPIGDGLVDDRADPPTVQGSPRPGRSSGRQRAGPLTQGVFSPVYAGVSKAETDLREM
jgi:hypothetical protein